MNNVDGLTIEEMFQERIAKLHEKNEKLNKYIYTDVEKKFMQKMIEEAKHIDKEEESKDECNTISKS